MTTTASKTGNQNKNTFTPNMENFRVSLSYEGLSLKKRKVRKSIEELKRQYAR